MKELTIVEMEYVGGAGWLQDGLASLGGKIGEKAWLMGSDLLTVELPLLGTINLATVAPDLGKNLGTSVGKTVGGTIESTLANLPVVGNLLNKWLGN